MLQDNINKIKPYFKSIESYNDALIVRVQFPPKWAVFPSDDNKIKPAPSEQTAYEYFYYGNGNDVSLDDIFGFIEKTIGVNQSLEEKAKLLVQKAKELQEIFETTPLEKLKTLRFAMEEPKKDRPKRKYTRKKKVAEKPKETNSDAPNKVVKVDTDANSASTDEKASSEVKVSASTMEKFKMAKARKEAVK